jgi:hypothetical protein
MSFKPDALAARGLPLVEYPVPIGALDAVLGGGGDIDASQFLQWIQEYIAHQDAPWRDYNDAMLAILSGYADPDAPDVIDAIGDKWSLVCGDVDLDGPVVSFLRDGELLANATRNDDGRLRISSYKPLDGAAISNIITVSESSAYAGTHYEADDNWEIIKYKACSTSQAYAYSAGRSYMALWEYGYGINANRKPDPHWYSFRESKPLPAAMLAVSLGIYYELSDRAF